jgi:hypothetical protein
MSEVNTQDGGIQGKPQKALRIASAVYFGVAGVIVSLALSLSGPSFWYVICAYAFTLTAIGWAWRPSIAAGLSIGPVIGLAFLFQYCAKTVYGLYLGGILAVAVVFVMLAFRERAGRNMYPIVVSLVLISLAFATDRLFTNKVYVVTYQMDWSVDGRSPWGDVGPISESGKPLVVLYRRVGDGYCYDALYSSELRDRLLVTGAHSATVEYNTFRDFGKMRSYNVRSVDEIVFHIRERVVRDENGFGGHILTGKESSSCW